MKTLLKHCHVISPGIDWENASILLNGAVISRVIRSGAKCPAADVVVDCGNAIAVPGFVDTHCHGKVGMDFCDGSLKALRTMAEAKLAEGVTTLLPTTLTLDFSSLKKSLESAKKYSENPTGCKVPGVHLEGPYINPDCLGAQNPKFVRKPDIAEVKNLAKIFPVLKVSYAVEVSGGSDFSKKLLKEKITPSCVHSAAKYAEFAAAYRNKLRSLSHYCNQMTPLHHRDIGLVGAGLLHQDVYIELICDKLHVSPEMIQLIFQHKDLTKIQLITDAMRAAGMPNGNYSLGGLKVIVKDGAARLENGALAGSTLAMNTALKNVFELTGIPLKELIRVTSLNQAELLGLSGIGKLEKGYAADLVLLDREFKVRATYVSGVCHYRTK